MIKKIKESLFSFNKVGGQIFFTCLVHKRILLSGALLFFLISGLTFANTALALTNPLAGISNLINTFLGFASNPVGSILNMGLGVVITIFGILVGIIGFVSAVFFEIAVKIANWVITSVVMGVPLTQLTTTTTINGVTTTIPTFVGAGWTLTRDLANMFFILVLVFIAIATILRIRDYEAKKALPRLIIMALLINFSPVIVGIIVDFFNILMNFFLSSITSTMLGWGNIFGNLSNYFGQLMSGSTAADQGRTVAYGIALTGFYLFGALIFVLIAIIFLFRVIAIWTLVILAPIAFWGYILPATKGWWSIWWKQLLQWSFIGLILAFFLYLASSLLSFSTAALSLPTDLGSLSQALPPLISLVFLLIGIMFGMQSSAVGANMIIGWAKKPGAMMAEKVKSLSERRIAGPATGEMAKTITRLENVASRLEKKSPIAKPLHWITRGAEMAFVPALTEYSAKQRKVSPPAGWKQMSVSDKEQYIKASGMESDRLVLASEMADEGTYQKTTPDFRKMIRGTRDKFNEDLRYKKEVGALQNAEPDEIKKEIKIKYQVGEVEQDEMRKKIEAEEKKIKEMYSAKVIVAEVAVKLGKKVNDVTDEEKQKFIEDKAAGRVHFKEMKTSDYAGIRKGSLTSFTGRVSLPAMTDRQIQKIYDTFGRDVMDKLVNEPGGINTIFEGKSREKAIELVEKIYDDNPRLFRFARTPAGQAMNFAFTKHMLDPNDQPTPSSDAFERRMGIKEKLNKYPILKESNEKIKKLRNLEEKIRVAKDIDAKDVKDDEAMARSLRVEINKLKLQIEADEELKEAQAEIEELKKSKKRK